MISSNRSNKVRGVFLMAAMLMAVALLTAQSASAATQTQNLAYIDSLDVINGGTFPSEDAAFSAFSFFHLTLPDITTANIGPGGICGTSGCDTVLLNVASNGMGCNVDTLSTGQKADLVSFVSNGGKLIISDSECETQNYSWLPYPFTTANPGAMGATGSLTIVEDNVLSDNNTADAQYIDAAMLASDTDAIGDMNVMTTLDSNWCLDMSGTNALQVSGPVHTYARYGNGLIIYLGMDVDYLYSDLTPSITSGDGNFAKLWLQELQAPFNPAPLSALPCGATVVGVNIDPLTAVNDLNAGQTEHTVTATLKDLLNNPAAGETVTFTVLSGPNTGAGGICSASTTCVSDANGQVSFTYTSDGSVGIDEIQACYLDSQEQERCSQVATKEWATVVPPSDVIDFSGSGGGSIGVFELFCAVLSLPLAWLRGRRCGLRASRPLAALLALLMVIIPGMSLALDQGWYVGASVGSAQTNASAGDYDANLANLGYTASSSIDDSDTGWKLFGGYALTPMWAVEGAYVDFGDVTSRTTVSSPALTDAVDQQQFVDDAATVHPYSVNGFALAAKGTLPLNPQFSVFAKLGVFAWDADIKVNCNGCDSTVRTSKSASGTDWTAGVGMGYDFNANVGLRVEIERYATDRDDVDFYSAGLEYRF